MRETRIGTSKGSIVGTCLGAFLGAIAITAGIGLGLTSGAGVAQGQTLPQYDDSTHLGVQTCAASTCHGAVQPWQNSSVLQNEFITWDKHDKHSKSYQTLTSDRSKRIAGNLGLESATTAEICLDCHANNVSKQKRAKAFQMSDGVGCEACHGGAENWLGIHVAGVAGHEENLKAGMYPTDQPVARAKLCLGCHYGTEKKFVTHRIMGAGHPRLKFELDTFTASQPAHFKVDADYRQRKTWVNGVKLWAIGQAVATSKTLEAMTDPKRNRDGIFPELVFFDCHACHHPMSNLQWQPRESVGLGPGVPRLNDANLVMLRVLAGVIDPALGKTIKSQTKALHQASIEGQDATVSAAKNLKATLDGLVAKASGHRFDGGEMDKMLAALIQEGLSGEYVSYITAEQATMAIASVMSAMERAGALKGAKLESLNKALENAYTAAQNDEKFKPDAYLAAIKSLDQARRR